MGFLPSEKAQWRFFFPRKLSKQVLSCLKCLTVKTVFLWCCWRAEVQKVGCSQLLMMYQWRLCFTYLCHKHLPTNLISQDQLFRKTSAMGTVVIVHTCCINVMSTTSRAKWFDSLSHLHLSLVRMEIVLKSNQNFQWIVKDLRYIEINSELKLQRIRGSLCKPTYSELLHNPFQWGVFSSFFVLSKCTDLIANGVSIQNQFPLLSKITSKYVCWHFCKTTSHSFSQCKFHKVH